MNREELVEAVAAAIAREHHHSLGDHERQAQAAIGVVLEAMREPTKAMIEAGVRNLPDVSPLAYGTLRPKTAYVWQAMIDAAILALKAGSDGPEGGGG